jgi:fumarate hydratase subunit beta
MSREKIGLRAPLIFKEIEQLKSGDAVLLSGTIYMARDAAHIRFHEELLAGRPLPFDPEGQVLYYSGPSLAKPGRPIGCCGPTTASRMDPYTPALLKRGLRGMIGKGKRSAEVLEAMRKYGCVYFGAIEGTAALISEKVLKAEIIAYADLGPEAVYRLEIKDLPLTVINDLRGGDLYIEGQKAYRNLV